MDIEEEIKELCRKADELKFEFILVKRASDIIKSGGLFTRYDLKRKCHFANKKMFDSILKILVKDGKIRVWRNAGRVKQPEQIEWIGKEDEILQVKTELWEKLKPI
jgi:hypothetical protein